MAELNNMKEQGSASASELGEALDRSILLFDGAMGTSIQAEQLCPEDFGGEDYEGCNENLVLESPQVITRIHENFLRAGADIIETNTFGASGIVLAEYRLAAKAREINVTAAKIARDAVSKHSSSRKPRFVAGSMGPTTKTISVTGGVTFSEMRASYREQAGALLFGGVDMLLLETTQDTINLKAALLGIHEAFQTHGGRVPVAISVTIETMGTMLAGQGVEALYSAVAHNELLALGLNCATGPDFMTDHLRTLASCSRFRTLCIPNAGLPDEDGHYNESPEMIAKKLERFVEAGWINIIGGCCGTTPRHIELLNEMVEGKTPRKPVTVKQSVVSGLEALVIDEDKRPVLVGERTNVIGSRKFKRLIASGKFEEGAELGRKQVRGGAQIVDVCLADPDREEMEDMTAFLDVLVKKIKVPLMVDSTDAGVIEAALQRSQGKALINSINLEDGEDRFAQVVPLAKRYGAAVVVGCIDEDPDQGMAVTRERKVQVARRSFDLLTRKYGVRPEDIIFDPLVFPLGTGDKNYVGAGEETIEGVRKIKEELPTCKTILGISNVSFGLPPAGREVLNSVFLYECVKAGLDLAIVNTEKLERYASLSDEEKSLSRDLIFWRGADPVAAFAAQFRDKKETVTEDTRSKLPLDERLALYIVEGSKDGLIQDLEMARKDRAPLRIINGPLMAGMDEVGRLFNGNELIVAEVLQSAESMKAAVAHLEPFMEKTESAIKGTVLLATVKGDVHDIGKNLVEIILANNGYKVVNIGIKVAPETLIDFVRQHRPDIIGLSGLLVKSAQQMVVTVQDLKAAAIQCPILVGGAALSPRFTANKIAPAYDGLVCYANDAMVGLDLANKIVDEEKRAVLLEGLKRERASLASSQTVTHALPKKAVVPVSISHEKEAPLPPDLRQHVLNDFDLEAVFTYLNPAMLYGKHLGLKGNLQKLLEAGNAKAIELYEQVQSIIEEVISKQLVSACGIYKFFRAAGDGDKLHLYSSNGTEVVETFLFPRQEHGSGLCLSDFVSPALDEARDYVAVFAVTCGHGVSDLAEKYRKEGQYLRSHIVQALAIEGAEAFAELIHERIRGMWGFADPPELTMADRFKAKYRGARMSFGYPACPRLEDQERLFGILPITQSIGVELTEGYMMAPEASVSALVFHHREANYFAILPEEAAAFEERIADPKGK